jgi:hypothetical protein
MNPRTIVRATVAAFSAAVFIGSAISAQASEVDTVSVEGAAVQSVQTFESAAVINPAVLKVEKEYVKSNKAKANLTIHREYRVANSKDARDLSGVEPSMYRGLHFDKTDEPMRKCIIMRESNGIYKITGGGNLDGKPGGDYQGAYQMTPDLARGVTYMMAKESKKTDDGLLSEARSLREKPANKWSRYWQDRAFYTILNYEGDNSGAKHWHSGGYTC